MKDIGNFVILGVTGDLSQRMLLPSLFSLDSDGLLPDGLAIIGGARAAMDRPQFIALVQAALRKRAENFSEATWQRFSQRLHYTKLDAANADDFHALAAMPTMKDSPRGNLFFLSLSPDHYAKVSDHIRAAGLNANNSGVIVEKPLGHDLESCQSINRSLSQCFDESRIFRIDHYLGKETVQNILALRFANTLFEPLWNSTHIDHVRITVFETVGVEGRWGYYNEYGALRDMVQNHVLQLLCLVALEPPATLTPDAVRDEKVKVLRSLRRISGADVLKKTVRGQYTDGSVDGVQVPGYTRETGGAASQCETFVAVEVNIDNWRWTGIPFILCTGKRMKKRLTEIQIQFRGVPHSVFSGEGGADLSPNRLTITLQPEEHVSLALMNKMPGLNSAGMRLRPLALDLSLSDAFPATPRRIAYEQLILDALNGRQTLFVRADEIEESWRWIDDIERGWQAHHVRPEPYWAGSDGPEISRLAAPVLSQGPSR